MNTNKWGITKPDNNSYFYEDGKISNDFYAAKLNLDKYQPITITKEILNKIQLCMSYSAFKGGYYIHIDKQRIICITFVGETLTKIDLRIEDDVFPIYHHELFANTYYFHSLQQLYYVLTGNHLIIKHGQ